MCIAQYCAAFVSMERAAPVCIPRNVPTEKKHSDFLLLLLGLGARIFAHAIHVVVQFFGLMAQSPCEMEAILC